MRKNKINEEHVENECNTQGDDIERIEDGDSEADTVNRIFTDDEPGDEVNMECEKDVENEVDQNLGYNECEGIKNKGYVDKKKDNDCIRLLCLNPNNFQPDHVIKIEDIKKACV